MQKEVTFYAKITFLATYVTFCTFCNVIVRRRNENMHVCKTYRKLNLKFVFNPIWAWNRDLNNYFKDVTKPYNRKYPKMHHNVSKPLNLFVPLKCETGVILGKLTNNTTVTLRYGTALRCTGVFYVAFIPFNLKKWGKMN